MPAAAGSEPVAGVLAAVLGEPGWMERVRAAAGDEDVRVVVVTVMPGSTRHPSPGRGSTQDAADAAVAIHSLPQPVLAAVPGACGPGVGAVLQACDIVLAADDAWFTVDGATVDAREAERVGLVTVVVPAAGLDHELRTLARELAAKDPHALRLAKRTLREVGAIAWDEVLDYNAARVAELQALQAGRPSPRAAGVADFLAGRSKPGLGT